jgi:hypothetical protein
VSGHLLVEPDRELHELHSRGAGGAGHSHGCAAQACPAVPAGAAPGPEVAISRPSSAPPPLGRVEAQVNDVDLLHEHGSVDSLKMSAGSGLNWSCRQIRPTVDLERPLCRAIDVRNQWVAFCGSSSGVVTTTASTWSTLMVGGRPGRGRRPAGSADRLESVTVAVLANRVRGHSQILGSRDNRRHLRPYACQSNLLTQSQGPGLCRPPRPPLRHRPPVPRQQQRFRLSGFDEGPTHQQQKSHNY